MAYEQYLPNQNSTRCVWVM